MTDKELLEQAAKAANYSIDFEEPVNGFYVNGYDENGDPATWWNPLTDDGDALRLAVKLAMRLGLPDERSVYVEVIGNCQILERVNGDPYAATRRAIVRAAAEIGKELK